MCAVIGVQPLMWRATHRDTNRSSASDRLKVAHARSLWPYVASRTSARAQTNCRFTGCGDGYERGLAARRTPGLPRALALGSHEAAAGGALIMVLRRSQLAPPPGDRPGPDPDPARNSARAAGRRPTCQWAGAVRDQPDGRGPTGKSGLRQAVRHCVESVACATPQGAARPTGTAPAPGSTDAVCCP